MITKTGLTSTPTGGAAFALACGTLAAVLLLLLAEFPTQVHAQTGSTDATLSSVTVDGVPVPGFVANRVRSDYGVASGVSQVTVAATTTHRVASWAITRPADADSRTDGHQVDLTAGRNVVRIEVTAEEGNTKAHWLRVNRGVDKEFGWKAGDDFDTLIAAGNGLPTGIWSDGTTMWVSDWEDTHMYAYDLDSGLRDKTREFDLKNGSPFGIWSDGETIWVVDNPDNRVYAYALSGGGRQKSRDIALHPDNRNPTGIWSDGETMWVGDHVDEHIYAYTLSGGARDDNREFGLHPLNYKVDGLWSNGTTMWVSDRQDDHIYAYTLSNGERDTEREFNTLLGAHNKNAVALWSDGKTMWVSDYHQDKIFSYNVGAGEDGGFAAVPTAPRSVAVESGGAGDLDVSWETPSRNGGSDITGYKVQWKQATGSWYTPADVSEATTTGTSHTITGLSPETEYTVRVIATSSVGDGPASAGAKGSAPQNTPATGAPTISGTAHVGETLTTDMSGIADADGLESVTFSYQWLADDIAISGAGGSTYTLAAADEGKTIRVRVSFSDDRGHQETLTSAATAPVSPADPPQEERTGESVRPHGLSATVEAGAVVLRWNAPDDESDVTMYRILRHRPEEGETEPVVHVDFTHSRATSYTDTAVEAGTLYVYSVQALNTFGFAVGEVSEPASVRVPTPVYDRAHSLRAIVEAGAVVLRWKAPTDDGVVTMYRILRHRPEEGEIGPLVYVAFTHNRATTYTDREVEAGTLYVYGVQALNTYGFAVGEASDPASVRMPGVQGGNSPATGAPAITGAVHVGAILTADTSGIADTDGLVETTFRYQWLADDANISGATSTTYLVTDADLGKFIKVKVSFSDDGDNDETLTSEATVAVEPDLPVTASIHDAPQSHDGESTFTFELRFSEEFKISYRTLRDHAFTVTGGRVEGARRLERNSDEPNRRWEIRIAPGSGGDVTIVLPIPTDCGAEGAICTPGGRILSNRIEFTVTGPGG